VAAEPLQTRGTFVRRVGRAITRGPAGGILLVPPRTASFALNAWVKGRNATAAADVPTPRLSAALAAQVALDELMLGVVRNPRRYPKDDDFVRMTEELRHAHDLYRERGWLDDLSAYHREPPPLGSPRRRPGWAIGLPYERVSWPSGYEPYEEEPGRDRWLANHANRTAHAWVIRAGADRPWLVCVHGFGVGVPTADFFAFRAKRLSRELGVNLLFPVLPYHGPRRNGVVGGAELISQNLHGFVYGMAQGVWDIRRAISWIRSQGGARIGVYGMSLGAYAAALLASLEDGLELVIAGAPLSDFPDLLLHHSPPAVLRRAEQHGIAQDQLADMFRVVSPLAAPPKASPERLYLFGGLGDRMATPEQAHKLWVHWNRPMVHWYEGSHIAFLWSRDVGMFIDGAIEEKLLG
jgi:hypothetical protein